MRSWGGLALWSGECDQPLHGRDDWFVEGFTAQQVQDAIDELIAAGLVVTRSDPHSGSRQIGLRDLVEAGDAQYEAVKESVYERAHAMGLHPTWRPGRGWRLVNGDGETVVEGPMQRLDQWFGEEARQ